MPLRRQTQVISQMDRMAGRTMRRAAKPYHEQTIVPLLAAIENATTPEQFQANLQIAASSMRTTALEEAAVSVTVQAGLIGRTTASSKRPNKTNSGNAK